MPPGENFNDSFSEKYSIMVSFIPENETHSFAQITKDSIDSAMKSNSDMRVLEINGSSRLGQLDAIKLVFTTKLQNNTLEITQLRTSQGNRAYAFNQQCLKGQCKYSNIFNEMTQTFEWKNP